MADNTGIIRKAFAGLVRSKDDWCGRVMAEVCRQAMQNALDSHDEEHQRHLEVEGDYGWAVFTDGVLYDMEILSSTDGNDESITNPLSDPPEMKGWCGVVMAGMLPKSYFSWDYEIGIITGTSQWVRQNFRTIADSVR